MIKTALAFLLTALLLFAGSCLIFWELKPVISQAPFPLEKAKVSVYEIRLKADKPYEFGISFSRSDAPNEKNCWDGTDVEGFIKDGTVQTSACALRLYQPSIGWRLLKNGQEIDHGSVSTSRVTAEGANFIEKNMAEFQVQKSGLYRFEIWNDQDEKDLIDNRPVLYLRPPEGDQVVNLLLLQELARIFMGVSAVCGLFALVSRVLKAHKAS